MNKQLAGLLATTLFGGCAHNGGPLVFVVTHTVGVDVQATSTTSATPGLTFGYKSVDLAVVPLQQDPNGGDTLTGCYAVGQNADIPSNCASNGQAQHQQLARATQSRAGALMPTYLRELGNDHRQQGENGAFIPVVLAAPPPALPGQSATDSTKYAEGVVDAYSVFASFNTNTSAGAGSKSGTDNTTTGNGGAGGSTSDATGTTQGASTKNGSSGGGVSLAVGLGELFATGDAAVQLAEGVNYYMARAGNAEIAKALSSQSCVQQTASGKGGGSDTSKESGCPSGASPAGAAAKTAPTLSSVTPTSGSAPDAGATAGNKVIVTLAGTGFGSTSALAITGTGVTYEQLMASSDGKTMAATLTIAPGAPKAACTIAVTNQLGGATSSGLTFTVN